MAELNIFHYISKDSALHRMDARFKLLLMISYTTASLFARLPGFIILTTALIFALIGSRLPLTRMLKEIRNFSLILAIIVVSQAYNVKEGGVITGLFLAWKLVLILILGSILTGTTSIAQLRNAVDWYFRRVPFLPAARIAIMTSLTVSLVPLIFDRASDMMDAQKARCIEQRRNPIRRIKFLAFPLLSRTFMRAEEMAFAMESRCYSEDRTEVVFKTSALDWSILFFSIVVCAFVIVI